MKTNKLKILIEKVIRMKWFFRVSYFAWYWIIYHFFGFELSVIYILSMIAAKINFDSMP